MSRYWENLPEFLAGISSTALALLYTATANVDTERLRPDSREAHTELVEALIAETARRFPNDLTNPNPRR